MNTRTATAARNMKGHRSTHLRPQEHEQLFCLHGHARQHMPHGSLSHVSPASRGQCGGGHFGRASAMQSGDASEGSQVYVRELEVVWCERREIMPEPREAAPWHHPIVSC